MKYPKIELVKSRAKKLYTPNATNYKLQWHIRIVARNGEIVLTSETYNSKAAAKKAITWMDRNLPYAARTEVDETGDKK
jgi:uncharacterized protein YegP (UPF0339 family)